MRIAGRRVAIVLLLGFAAMGAVLTSGGWSASTPTTPLAETAGSGVPAAAAASLRSVTSTSVPTSTPVATRTAVPTITIAAVGDLCFASSVKRLVGASGPKAPFSATRKLLSQADVTVGNLECALSRKGHAVLGKKYTFEGPPAAITGLRWAGFDLLAQGNNHARDYGSAALKDTMSRLDKAKIAHAGAGRTSKSAFRPTYITRNGAKIAFLSYSQIGPANFKAGSHSAGTAYTQRLATVTKAIKAAHRHADYVIVSFHWGIERRYPPTATQVRFGHAAVRAGADLVLSHHPHVIEGVEFYRKGLIAYSLGNFVFSPGSTECHDTMILTLTLGPKGIHSVVAKPALIDPAGRPRYTSGSTRRRILGTIKRTSRALHTHVTISNGTAKLRK
jgi:poly-gamma-glutamate capsule biosynthesis protein CapA/YwtB (metallophosphatase superfamily)